MPSSRAPPDPGVKSGSAAAHAGSESFTAEPERSPAVTITTFKVKKGRVYLITFY